MKILIAFFMGLVGLSYARACYKETDVVTLDGVVTTRAVHLTKDDFGWAPENGFDEYFVFVSSKPVCVVQDEGNGGATDSDLISVLQMMKDPGFNAKELSAGIRVQITGTLMAAHTGHHFQPILISPSKLSRSFE